MLAYLLLGSVQARPLVGCIIVLVLTVDPRLAFKIRFLSEVSPAVTSVRDHLHDRIHGALGDSICLLIALESRHAYR